jgi:hypothetical protein
MDRVRTQVGTEQETLAPLGDQLADHAKFQLEETAAAVERALGPVGRLKVYVRRFPARSCGIAFAAALFVGYRISR